MHACLACVCVCVSLLTAFTPPESYDSFSPAFLFSRDSGAIYMFTFTISICCFWNNQLQGPGGGAAANRARLGFHDFWGGWRRVCVCGAGSDYAELGVVLVAVGGRGALSRFVEESRGSWEE